MQESAGAQSGGHVVPDGRGRCRTREGFDLKTGGRAGKLCGRWGRERGDRRAGRLAAAGNIPWRVQAKTGSAAEGRWERASEWCPIDASATHAPRSSGRPFLSRLPPRRAPPASSRAACQPPEAPVSVSCPPVKSSRPPPAQRPRPLPPCAPDLPFNVSLRSVLSALPPALLLPCAYFSVRPLARNRDSDTGTRPGRTTHSGDGASAAF